MRFSINEPTSHCGLRFPIIQHHAKITLMNMRRTAEILNFCRVLVHLTKKQMYREELT